PSPLSLHYALPILDEPSSSLDRNERERLFSVIRTLRERGTAIVYISHRLEEIFEIADRVSVLKDGKLMGTCRVSEIDRIGLIRLMVGRAIEETCARQRRPRREPVLEVRGLSRPGALDDTNLVWHRRARLADGGPHG